MLADTSGLSISRKAWASVTPLAVVETGADGRRSTGAEKYGESCISMSRS